MNLMLEIRFESSNNKLLYNAKDLDLYIKFSYLDYMTASTAVI